MFNTSCSKKKAEVAAAESTCHLVFVENALVTNILVSETENRFLNPVERRNGLCSCKVMLHLISGELVHTVWRFEEAEN